MTHINPTCPHGPKVNANSARRATLNPSRRHGVLLAYDGVTAAYIRDISTRAGLGTSRRFVPEPGPAEPYADVLTATAEIR
jgi:hypothetical protein